MSKLLKKTGDKLKKAGHTVEEKAASGAHKAADATKAGAHKAADVTKAGAHKAADVTKAAGRKTVKGARTVAGHMDFTCDNCGKVMKPGGEYSRVVKGKEYQFCSVPCRDHFHPPLD